MAPIKVAGLEEPQAISVNDHLMFLFTTINALTNVLIPVPQPGEYTVALCTDDEKYGGFGQIQHITYPTKLFDGKHYVELYLPARTAVVLKEIPKEAKAETAPAAVPAATAHRMRQHVGLSK